MEISVLKEEARVPVTVFDIEGSITAESYLELQQQAEDAFTSGARNLLLDLSEVSFVSSSGLRAFHHIFTLFRAESDDESDAAVRKGLMAGTYHSPHFKLLNPDRNVLQSLKVSGFDMFLEIHSDMQAALASF